jgi:hypothetical protein
MVTTDPRGWLGRKIDVETNLTCAVTSEAHLYLVRLKEIPHSVRSLNSMPYKPDQLPFEEFEPTARAFKLQLDDRDVHYPITATAYDRHGVPLLSQTWEGPHKRPKVQVINHLKEWELPVSIKVEDKSGRSKCGCFATITVEGEPQTDAQILFEESHGDLLKGHLSEDAK